MSIERDYLTEFNAEIIFGKHNSSIAVAIHRFISSCMNSEVVIDFFIIVRMIFSVNWYILRWKRLII